MFSWMNERGKGCRFRNDSLSHRYPHARTRLELFLTTRSLTLGNSTACKHACTCDGPPLSNIFLFLTSNLSQIWSFGSLCLANILVCILGLIAGVNISFYAQIFHLGKVFLFREFREEFHESGLRELFCRGLEI
jgi:hypothetical protein